MTKTPLHYRGRRCEYGGLFVITRLLRTGKVKLLDELLDELVRKLWNTKTCE